MDFNNFENTFFSHLRKNNNECFKDISENEAIIKSKLGDDTSKFLNSFVNKFNDAIIDNNDGKFEIYEKILREKMFDSVLEELKNSNILIRACEEKRRNEKLINWLLTMDINSCVQNENGVTALMAASKDPELLFVVKHILGHDSESIDICDKNGETALFYAVHNIETFKFLLDANISTNCLNKDNDSILTYCCKNRFYEPVKILSTKTSVDANIFNNDERTAAMYLIEDGRYQELKLLINEGVNFYYENGKNESAISILFKKYYEIYIKLNTSIDEILPYINIIKILIDSGISFNTSIDKEGNTPLMLFIMVEDWSSLTYLITNGINLDFSVENKNGESASSLLLKHKPTKESYYSRINVHYLIYSIISHSTFNTNVRDNAGNNIIMNYIISNCMKNQVNMMDIFTSHTGLLSAVNENQENALIIATKLGRREILKKIISVEGKDINHQDSLGNTALHYAVMLNDYYIANYLARHQADINIKNKDGKSPINMVKEIDDSTMMKLLLKPSPPYEIEKMEKKDNSKFSFGKTYKFKELKEGLRIKYQEKYDNEIIDKSESKYHPNYVAPSYNSTYHIKALHVYFTILVYEHREDEVQLYPPLNHLILRETVFYRIMDEF